MAIMSATKHGPAPDVPYVVVILPLYVIRTWNTIRITFFCWSGVGIKAHAILRQLGQGILNLRSGGRGGAETDAIALAAAGPGPPLARFTLITNYGVIKEMVISCNAVAPKHCWLYGAPCTFLKRRGFHFEGKSHQPV